jgi:hypothetical protein
MNPGQMQSINVIQFYRLNFKYCYVQIHGSKLNCSCSNPVNVLMGFKEAGLDQDKR